MKIEVFEPKTLTQAPSKSIPAVVMCHGFGVSKEFYANHGVEFANLGYIAVSMEMRGHGHTSGDFLNGNYSEWVTQLNLSREMTEQFPDMSYIMAEVDAVFAYLTNRPEVNMSRIGLIGHSTGGGVVLLAAMRYSSNVVGTIAMSPLPVPGVNATSHQNLMIIIGKYDEAFSYTRELTLYQEATGDSNALEGAMRGNFADGSARQFILTPLDDHFTIIVNPTVMATTVNWLASAIEGQPTDLKQADLLYMDRLVNLGLIMVGGVFIFVFIGIMGLKIIGENRVPIEQPEILQNTSTIKWFAMITGLSILLFPLTYGTFFLLFYTTSMSVAAMIIPLFTTFAASIMLLLWITSKREKKEKFSIHQIATSLLLDANSWKEFLLGIGTGTLLLIILQLSMGSNITNMVPPINRLGQFLFLAIWIFAFLFAQEILTHMVLEKHPLKRADDFEAIQPLVKTIIQRVQVAIISFFFNATSLILGIFLFTQVITTKFVWMMAALMLPLIFGIQLVNALFYPYSKRILFSCTAFTIIITSALVAMSPYIYCL
jgi:dienelactone hydrolase